jgi:release factor glutamine methyltransferase
VSTLKELLSYAAGHLKEAGIDNPLLDARLLLQHTLNLSTEEFITHTKPINKALQQKFKTLITRRQKHEPIAYILSTKQFYGLEFYITLNTLIPRNDSEILIDAVIENYKKNQPLKILDLGTGSGCLILTLLKHFTQAQAVAVDISKKALQIAIKNAHIHNLQDKIAFIHSNWFSDIDKEQIFDLIISNPPYIGENEKNHVNQETFFEPALALFAGNNGLACYEKIAKIAQRHLTAQGNIYLEIGFRQRKQVENIFIKNGFQCQNIYKDFSGHERCIQLNLINSL